MQRISVVIAVVVLVSTLAAGTGAVVAQSPSQSQAETPTQSESSSQASQPSLPQLQCGDKTYEVDVRKAVSLYHENTDAVPSPVGALVSANTTELRISGASQQYYTIHMDSSL
jgi:hypothetical protein